MENESTTLTVDKPKKSVALTKEERKALKNYRKKFITDVDCADAIGIHRSVFAKIILSGTGAPETVDKVRAALAQGDNKAA